MLSYAMMPICIAGFPHIYSHWLSARNADSFRATIVFYPLCFVVVWFPSVVLGAIALLVLSFGLGPLIGFELMPESDEGRFVRVDPALLENVTEEGQAAIAAVQNPNLDPEWPVGLQIPGWTTYTDEALIECADL